MAEPTRTIRRRGWTLVGIQALLLVTLVLLPRAGHWPTPGPVQWIASAVVLGGLAIAAVAALGLGRGLTPTPVPNGRTELRTSGLYGIVRHPIYSGVLLIVAGVVLGSGNVLTLAVGAITVVFFDRKAAWEEELLRSRFPDYDAYAERVPRLIPGRTGRRRHRDRS